MTEEIYGATNIHPIGAVALVVALILLALSRREMVPVVFIIVLAVLPSAQRIVVGSLDFNFARLLIIAIIVRAIVRRENNSFQWLKVDNTLMLWAIWSVLAYGWLHDSMSALITRSGYIIDCVGSYLAARIYIRDSNDFLRVGRSLALLSVPMLIFFLIERQTGRNIFAVFGGVPELTLVREGRIRCQGPFSHPIMAGVFWAYVFTYLVGIWRSKLMPFSSVAPGIACSMLIVANTASSTPAMAIVFALFGFSLYKLRYHLNLMRWALVTLLVLAHVIMEKPVWHLIARVNVFAGSTGWHRYHLIDQAINRIDEWFLVGTTSTAHWGDGLADVTNQFILEAVRSGALGLALFVLFYVRCFKLIGMGARAAGTDSHRQVVWTLGVSIFVTVGNFLAVSYFGQLTSALHFFVGMVVSISFFLTQQNNSVQIRQRTVK